MKEYIYLDTELVNSYLAQLDEGVLSKMITGSSSTNTNQEDGGNEIKNTTKGGVQAYFANGGHEYSKTEIDKYSSVYSQNNSELIETALNDYSLDILLDKLRERNLLQDSDSNWEDGEMILSSGKLNVFNFSQIQKSTVPDVLANVHPEDLEITRLKNELETLMKNNQSILKHSQRIIEVRANLQEIDPFGSLNKMSEFMDILFPETTLFNIENLLIMCANENMRTNIPTLSLYSYTDRKFKVLGVIISNNKKTLVPNGEDSWPAIKIASESPAAFMEIMLNSFEISNNDSYFIKPIAIYYEKE